MQYRSLATTLTSNASNITATSTPNCPLHTKTPRIPSMYAPNNETLSLNLNDSNKNLNNKSLNLCQYQIDISQTSSNIIENYQSNKPPPNFPPPPPPPLISNNFF